MCSYPKTVLTFSESCILVLTLYQTTHTHTHLILKLLGLAYFFSSTQASVQNGSLFVCLSVHCALVQKNTNSLHHTVHAEPATLNHMHTDICRQAERAGPPT